MGDLSLTWIRTEFDQFGNRVDVYRASEAHSDTCAYCADGNCEQEVHRSAAYECDLVVHDRPAALN
jgi:hypothetical protein